MLKGSMVTLLVAVSLVVAMKQSLKVNDEKKIEELNVYLPFVFSENIDPRKVFTVGDQVISDHVFAFHFSTSLKNEKRPLFSDVAIDRTKNTIQIKKKRPVFNSEGKELSFDEICSSVKSSFSGTQHTNYGALIRSMTCVDNQILIELTSMPINIEYWLRSTDFAIFDSSKVPLSANVLSPTTGPYYITKHESKSVTLVRNKFYPHEITSNSIDRVNFKSYSFNEQSFVEGADLAYLYGYSVSNSLLESLRDKNYKIQIFPNEWLLYIGFQKTVAKSDREKIAALVDSLKEELVGKIIYGSLAYSVIPSDRPYGLSKNDFKKPIINSASKLSKKVVLATLDEWIDIPIFSFVIKELTSVFNIEVKTFSRKDMAKVYSKDVDLFMSPLGISSSDPIGNFLYLNSLNETFRDGIPKKTITDSYHEYKVDSFSEKMKAIEAHIMEERLIIPIGHFPGIVIESPRLLRDESKAWDWGIQAWTYKII